MTQTTLLEPLGVSAEPLEGPCSPDCRICTTSILPGGAYRPHTFKDDCWCTRSANGHKILAKCYMASWIR
jgi:hypothetical protein